MKLLKNSLTIFTLAAMLFFTSCGNTENSDGNSGSESQTTANDSSGTESRTATGVGEDNQKEVGGYPSNQSNLNSDSTSRLHDVDTTKKTTNN